MVNCTLTIKPCNYTLRYLKMKRKLIFMQNLYWNVPSKWKSVAQPLRELSTGSLQLRQRGPPPWLHRDTWPKITPFWGWPIPNDSSRSKYESPAISAWSGEILMAHFSSEAVWGQLKLLSACWQDAEMELEYRMFIGEWWHSSNVLRYLIFTITLSGWSY